MLLLRRLVLAVVPVAALAALVPAVRAQEGFKFKTGVELITVTATVTTRDGRFLSGLKKEDFTIYDNDEEQTITHFSSDRVPVSLGILLDTSGSMADDKIGSARRAINRFVTDLLDDQDEIFFMEFNDRVTLRQDWTHDRRAIMRAVNSVNPVGGTAMYDAIAEALPVAAGGQHTKKALLVISDGNDSDSEIKVSELRQAIRESEVLVYALGIDGAGRGTTQSAPRAPRPIPFPIPGIGQPRPRFPLVLPQIIWGGGSSGSTARVNASALRQITDDTGGRTEVIKEIRDLDGATARIADELSKQYSLGYTGPGDKDGKWHRIRVVVSEPSATVRARTGYFSS
jgi:Ca-activated chloride channel family protein